MTEMLSASITGGQQLQEALVAMTPRLAVSLKRGMTALLIRMQSFVKREELSGQVLHRRTGNLSRSIHYGMRAGGQEVVGRLFVGPNAPYGAVHEYGGVIMVPAHQRTITEAFGHPLKMPVTFTVRSHTAGYPQRAFMRPALAKFREDFRAMVTNAAVEAMKGPAGGGPAAATPAAPAA